MVHHFAAENYRHLAKRFPEAEGVLTLGSIGENVSTSFLCEETVFVGDVFSLGTARVQVSQPRSPCWKIDRRYGTPGMAHFIFETGFTGWYYRVLETGNVSNGEHLELLDRLPEAVSLRELWQVWAVHRPDPVQLLRVGNAPALNSAWRKKLLDRYAWLRANC